MEQVRSWFSCVPTIFPYPFSFFASYLKLLILTLLFSLFSVVYAGQQARILGENYTIEDEEDSRVGTVSNNGS